MVKHGFLSKEREAASEQSTYHSPDMYDPRPEDPEVAPFYDAPLSRWMAIHTTRTSLIYLPSFGLMLALRERCHELSRASCSKLQRTYQSITNPPVRHVSQLGSLHQSQRPSPPRTVRNPYPPSPTGVALPIQIHWPSQPPRELEPESASETPCPSPLEPTRRPSVTVQNPNGSPVYIDTRRPDDYADMGMARSSNTRPSLQYRRHKFAHFAIW